MDTPGGNNITIDVVVDSNGAITELRGVANEVNRLDSTVETASRSFTNLNRDLNNVIGRSLNTGQFRELGESIRSVFDGNLDSDRLESAIQELGREFVESGGEIEDFEEQLRRASRTTEDSRPSFSRLQASIITLNQGFQLLRGGFRTISEFSRVASDLAREARDIENLSIAFENLQASIGANATSSINSLRTATQGLVTDLDLFRISNNAVTLGVATSEEQFARLAEGATRLGQALGRTAAESIGDITTGIGRQSRLILDNLGIIVDATAANERFAASIGVAANSLTDSQRQAAFANETIRQLEEAVSTLPPSTLSAAQAFGVVEVSISNLRTSFLQQVSGNNELRDAFLELNTAINSIDTEGLGNALTGLVSIFTNSVIPAINLAIGVLDEFFSLADSLSGLDAINESINVSNNEGLTLASREIQDLRAELRETGLEGQQFSNAYNQGINQSIQKFSVLARNSNLELQRLNDRFAENAETSRFAAGEKAELTQQIQQAEERAATFATTLTTLRNAQNGISVQSGQTSEALGRLRRQQNLNNDQTIRDVATNNNLTESLTDLQRAQERFNESVEDLRPPSEEFKRAEDAIRNATTELSRGNIEFEEFQRIATQASNSVNLTEREIDRLSQSIQEGTREIDQASESLRGLQQELGRIAATTIGDLFNGTLDTSSIASSLGSIGGLVGETFRDDIAGAISSLGLDLGENAGAIGGAIGSALGSGLVERFATESISGVQSLLNGDELSTNEEIALALPTFGLSFIADDLISGLFGNSDPGANARAAFRDYFNNLIDDTGLDIDPFEILGGRNAFDQFRNSAGELTTIVTEEFQNLNLTNELADSFNGLGIAFREALNIEDINANQLSQLLAVNFETPAGLNDLQILLRQAEVSAEDLQEQLENAFLTGDIAAGEFLNASRSITDLYADGIPGAIGDVRGAFENFRASLDRGGAFSQDAIADIGAEAAEAGRTFAELPAFLESLGAETQQVNQLFSQLTAQGIDSLEGLENISVLDTANLVASLENANFAFNDTRDQIEDLNNRISNIPDSVVTNYTLNVDTNFRDDAARQLVEEGEISLPTPTGQGLG